jgi:hypothetical protein
MIPSAKSESRERLPPEKVLRKLRMPPPAKLFCSSLTALRSTPGAGM